MWANSCLLTHPASQSSITIHVTLRRHTSGSLWDAKPLQSPPSEVLFSWAGWDLILLPWGVITSYHISTENTHTPWKKGAIFVACSLGGKNKHTFLSGSPPPPRPLSDDAGIFGLYKWTRGKCKDMYVFILMRVFIQIYFWILFTRSEELWLFPLHMNLI